MKEETVEIERTGLEIAVIGMGIRTPGAEDRDEFWDLLKNGIEAVSFFSDGELLDEGIDQELLDLPNYVKAKCVVEGKENFDANFFDYMPEEAKLMHPQARLFHQCVWTALEDAGYVPGKTSAAIGVYAGAQSSFNFEALTLLKGSNSMFDSFSASILKDKDFLSTRIAYKLGLKGPAIAMQSACSTSLVAIHMACRGLLSGECDIALAGGVSISHAMKNGYVLTEGLPFSHDGHVRTFDSRSTGVSHGEGVGVVVLKALEDALEDGDTIHAIVIGSAINNDGYRKVGYTAPSVLGQTEVIQAALHMAEVEAESISYVEAHGTATELGDSVEVEALKRAFDTDKKHFCYLGSLKSNMGHLDMAAGVGGFVKTVLALKHRQIPPSLHYENPNPDIDFENSPFMVNARLTPWHNEKYPLRAGVSAFGIGGTNAHVLLEEAPEMEESSPSAVPYYFLPISAKTMAALDRNTENLGEHFRQNPDINLADAAYMLQMGREDFRFRRMLIAASNEETTELLREPTALQTADMASDKVSTVFMFSGHDIPYVNMGLELYRTWDLFKEHMDNGMAVLKEAADVDIKPSLYPAQAVLEDEGKLKEAGQFLTRVDITSPIKFIYEYALIQLLLSWGIEPDAMIGHSLGEYIAACLAGVFSFEDGIRLVSTRAKLIEKLPPAAMMSVTCSEEKLIQLVALHNGIDIAVISSDKRSMVSGTREAIKEFKAILKEKRIGGVVFPVSRGGHSRQMDPILDEFEAAVRKITLNKPTIPYISGLAGNWIKAADAVDPLYWRRHLRETMRFADALTEVFKMDNVVFIQPGAERTLVTLANQHPHKKPSNAVVCLTRHSKEEESDIKFLLHKLGTLWLYGVSVKWEDFHAKEKRNRIPLPTYSYDKRAYWIHGDPYRLAAKLFNKLPQADKKEDIADWFWVPSWKRAPLAAYDATVLKNKTVLLVADETETMDKLLSQFKQDGIETIVVNPGEKNHFSQLFNRLKSTGQVPVVILHLQTPGTVDGFHSLLHLSEVFVDIPIRVVSSHLLEVMGNESLEPLYATLLGAVKSLPHCRLLDIPTDVDTTRHILAETVHHSQKKIAAIRNGRRWVQDVEAFHIPQTGQQLPKNSVLLVAGRLSPAMDTFLKQVAQTLKPTLLMLEEPGFPVENQWEEWMAQQGEDDYSDMVEKVNSMNKLKSLGAHIKVLHADPTNKEQLRGVMAEVHQQHNNIDGYCRSVSLPVALETEVNTIIAMDEILEGIVSGFHLYSIDISSLLDDNTPAEQKALVEFLGAFTAADSNHKKTLIAWNPETQTEIGHNSIEVINRILAQKLPQAIISNHDASQYHLWDNEENDITADDVELPEISQEEMVLRPSLSTPYKAPETQLQKSLTDIWKQFFGIQDIGIDDDFFELGGDSLKAMGVVSYIHKALNIKIPLAEIFNMITIRKLAAYLENMDKEETVYAAIEKAPQKDHYRLSSSQKRLFILQQMDYHSIAYNMLQVIPLQIRVEAEKLEEVFRKIIQRHEVMRTSFITIDEEPWQKIHDSVDFKIKQYTLPNLSHEEVEQVLKRFVRPFDLSQAPLFRSALLTAREAGTEKGDRQILVVDMHHIISDANSNHLLVSDFQKLFSGMELEDLPLQYKDYAEWQNSDQHKELFTKQEAYWLSQYQEEAPLLTLPYDFPRPPVQRFDGDEIDFSITQQETLALREMARKEETTLFMVVFTTYNILLSKLSGNEDIVVGTQILGRRHPDLMSIIGMFVNALALRNFPSSEKTFHQLLTELKKRTLEAFENQEYPFEELVGKSSVQRDTSRNPIFDVSFALHNFTKEDGSRNIQQELEQSMADRHKTFISRFDITLTGLESEEKLFFTFEYATKLFKKETIHRFINYFKAIVAQVIANDRIKIGDIGIISDEEKNEILDLFNTSDRDYPQHKTLYQLFEDQVEKSPDSPAIKGRDRNLNYQEVNQCANQLARRLLDCGAAAGSRVGMVMDRSIEMVLGILGILKAGGAYLPISPDYPGERIEYMLKDSAASAVLTQGLYRLLPGITASELTTIDIDNPETYSGDNSNLEPISSPEDLSYIIYTSGSTGTPKGVAVQQRSVVNIILALQDYYPLNSGDVYLLKTSYLFDVSVSELFGWFPGGGTLAVLDKDGEKDPTIILDTIANENVTHINFVPSMFNLFVDTLNMGNIHKLADLRYLFLAGEAIFAEPMARFMKLDTQVMVENIYGPTENTIYGSRYSLKYWSGRGSVSIGKPVANVKLYTVDKGFNLQPIGIPGELLLSGAGVARGYLNNPELSAAKFVKNPFDRDGNHPILYRTGDLARWLPDGNIDFMGRIDHQVKIRGFRIELGEIESRILEISYIREAVVIDKEEEIGGKYLCAYIVTDQEIDSQQIRENLLEHLPGYMVPAYFMPMKKIPLNPSGKLDRKALPDPVVQAARGQSYVAPRNDVEEKLVDLWADVLAMEAESIGIDTPFFQLGGHSLKATVLVSRIHKTFNVNLALMDIFKRPTVRQQAERIEASEEDIYAAIQPVTDQRYYPLSPAQQRMYIVNQIDPSSIGYNMSTYIMLQEEISIELIEEIFKQLIQRHESLRTSFKVVDGLQVQEVEKEVDFTVEVFPVKESQVKETARNFLRPHDLSKAPLIRVAVAQVEGGTPLLMVDIHHIIGDGISTVVLVTEFMSLYRGLNLPPLRIQYKDYASWLNSDQQKDRIDKQIQYWVEMFQGEIPLVELTPDFPRPAERSIEGGILEFVIPRDKVRQLNQLCKQQNTTVFMGLLAVFNILVAKVTNREDILLGTPMGGRNHVDLENLIGMFVNMLVLRNYPKAEQSFEEFLADVRERTIEAFNNQDCQFEDLVEKLGIERDLSRNPIFDIVFSYQGVDGPEHSKPTDSSFDPESYNSGFRPVQYDVIMTGTGKGDTITFTMEYCKKLFREETIERYIQYYNEILGAVLANKKVRLSDIDITLPDNILSADANDIQEIEDLDFSL